MKTMKKILSVILVLLMVLSMTAMTVSADSVDYTGKTIVLYTANVRGDVSIYEKVAAAKDAYEAAGATVYLVDAGNCLQGAAEANYNKGNDIYPIMSAAGYDVAGMGLYEFVHGEATTGYKWHGNLTAYKTQAQMKAEASFKVICSNLAIGEESSGYYDFDANVVLGDTLKVGFVCSAPADLESMVQDGFLQGYTEQAVAAPSCDILVALGSGEGDIEIPASANGEMKVGAYLIDNATKAISELTVDLTGSNAEVKALADASTAAAKDLVVGKSEVTLSGKDSVAWNGEINLGDFTADALKWYAENKVEGLKDVPVIGLINGGNCDSFLYSGEITSGDLLESLPFSPKGVGVVYVTGEQLLEVLEAATQCENCPGFAQVSGLEYEVHTYKTYDAGEAYGNYFKANSINRVVIKSVDGQPFDETATYAIALDNILVDNGMDTYYMLPALKESGNYVAISGTGGLKVRDVAEAYIEEALGGVIGEKYATTQNRITVYSNFVDVAETDWFYDSVKWAVENEITNGGSDNKFYPMNNCTRAEIVTFLWRQAGSPEPTSSENPFADVADGQWYTKAVLWAVEKGITNGTSTGFEPNRVCTRSEIVTFLYRAAGSPEVTATSTGFADVPANEWYTEAVLWAVENGITNGTNNGFEPMKTCTRAEAVTFIQRFDSVKTAE